MRARDPHRFEALFDAEFRRCAQTAARIVGDVDAAEELASEAFARAWSRWDRLDGGRSPGGWVMRVTINLAIDRVRRRRPDAEVVAASTDPGEGVADRLALAAALRSLPRRQRDVVILRCLDDRSERDVAEALGVSVGAVKTHFHRGLARLREELGEEVVI